MRLRSARLFLRCPVCVHSRKESLIHVCNTKIIRHGSTSSCSTFLPLSHFIKQSASVPQALHFETSTIDVPPYLSSNVPPQTYYIEPYGCQMNFADADLINAILQSSNFIPSQDPSTAKIILLVTCAIRENAETKIFRRLESLQELRRQGGKIALLGCMAERLKFRLLEGERLVD